MQLKLSYFDPRDNLRIGIYIGLFFGLGGGGRGLLAGAIIGLILAAATAYITPRTLDRRVKYKKQEDDIQSYALVTGIIIAIFGSLLFSGFKPAPAIALFVCPIVALRSGSRVKKTVEEIAEKRRMEKARILDYQKQVSDAVDVVVDVQEPLRTEAENPIKITIVNPSDIPITNISIKAECSRLVRCDEPEVSIDVVNPDSSEYNAIFLYPRISDRIGLGKIHVSYLINGNFYRKEPMDIGVYEATQMQSSTDTGSSEPAAQVQIFRETEFYQGFVRLKMAVNNLSDLVVNDVALEFDFDEHLFRIDRFEPAYSVKNNRLLLGNIEGSNSKSVAVYFDPLICSKSSEINCTIFYKDAKGKLLNTNMRPKKIAVTCPIMKTDADLNIGMLRELLDKLPFKDSKVYRIRSELAASGLMNICREMVQRHDVRHVRTLKTKDGKNYETWYYGKTKVNGHDIILKITISEETGTIELFGATRTAESLVGLLADFGRELCKEMESNTKGKSDINQVVNVNIKDSIIQRSNLLNSCDLSGNCGGDVVIEDSIIQRTEMLANFCSECGARLQQDANFCSECGSKTI